MIACAARRAAAAAASSVVVHVVVEVAVGRARKRSVGKLDLRTRAGSAACDRDYRHVV